jgi:hypothetical protein
MFCAVQFREKNCFAWHKDSLLITGIDSPISPYISTEDEDEDKEFFEEEIEESELEDEELAKYN